MQALVDSHLFVRKMEPKELFQTAYQQKFKESLPETTLLDDVAKFLRYGQVPAYLTAYMVQLYGAH